MQTFSFLDIHTPSSTRQATPAYTYRLHQITQSSLAPVLTNKN
ncbi:hypothetical protein QVO10_09065 [Bacteroides gallinaceum]|uniref:Uncharacterized protein n=2 Tax=Bacteroides gallinaceum TaxID=1462571 RepID=A0ABT7X6L7_9BACE|nr:hypothetical protein [Bacteroides gallinaceum]MDN0049533.1 hypothetical protein [Bacteroides gallinaceum]